MDFILPNSNTYTIYSKSDCSFCKKAKQLLSNVEPKPLIIECNDYLLQNRKEFLDFIFTCAGREYKTFPMVFHNGTFIGGFTELKEYHSNLQKQNAFLQMDYTDGIDGCMF